METTAAFPSGTSETSDTELMRNYVERGDGDAFAVLVRRYMGGIRGVCSRRLGGETLLLDDCVQTVFVVLSRKAASLPQDVNLGPWLHRVATYVCIDALRRIVRDVDRREVVGRDQARHFDATQGELSDRELVHRALDEAINELSERERAVTVGHYLQGRSFEKLAEQMRCKAGYVRVTALRARRRLQGLLRRKGVTVAGAAFVAILEGVSAEAAEEGKSLVSGHWSVQECSQRVRSTADAVMAEMDRAAARAMWWKVGGVAAGLATIGVGTTLVAHYLQSVQVPSDPTTTWRIESVAGSPLARRGETVLTLKAGDVLRLGDTILTSSNEEIRAVSEMGDRVLLRQEGEVGFGTGNDDTNPAGSGDPAYKSSDVGRVTSRGAVPSNALYLTKGAIVAQVKRPTSFVTPHAGVETDGADFFLMVANGMTTNATPWSFSRVDVTEGRLKLETGNSKPETGPPARSENLTPDTRNLTPDTRNLTPDTRNLTPDTRNLTPLEISSGQFAAVGTDMEGQTIATKAGKSDCRELSPKHGGVFFREYVELYETKGAALGVLRFTEGRVLLETNAWQMTDKLMTLGGPKIAKRTVGRTGESALVIANGTADVAWASVPLGLPSVDAFQVTVRHVSLGNPMGSYSLSCYMQSLPIQTLGQAVTQTDSGERDVTAGVWDLFKMRFIRVGVAPGGRSVYETDITGFNWIYFPDPKKWGPSIETRRVNVGVGIGAIRIEELRRARENAGAGGARGLRKGNAS